MSDGGDYAASRDTIRIRNKEIPVEIRMIPVADLSFYIDNPRVYSALRTDGLVPDQEEIQRVLSGTEHVRELVSDIRRNGGLTDPVIVRDTTLDVLEGNSRLAAYRTLAAKDPLRWNEMKCRVVPADIADRDITALLSQYHMTGKKDWAMFEQAGLVYRQHRVHDLTVDEVVADTGLKKAQVEKLISTYQFMVDHEEVDPSKWSYYYEYLKNRVISKARLDDRDLDSIVVSKIKSREIERAQDVRDRLPHICAVPKTLRKFVKGERDFETAHEDAVASGADDGALKKLTRFRGWLNRPEAGESMRMTTGETRKKIEFELQKLERKVAALRKSLDNGSSRK